MEVWATVGATALFILNLSASIAAVRSVSLTRAQKWIHVVLVWLTPVVGAILILGFLITDRPPPWRSNEEEPQAVGDVTVLDLGPSPCGCSETGSDSD